jgi:membrane-associated phospholipid phosphatase/rhodanese-related sulfurtransferase
MRQRWLHLALNGLVFSICYPLANLLAHQQHTRRSLAFAWDETIAFAAWMVVPYITSGLIFMLVFFAVRTAEQLRVVSRRLLLATVAGCLVFAMVPARFTFERPAVPDAVPAALYGWLDLVDQPYNQFPSLHVAYCVIFWCALRPLCGGWTRAALAAWLLLVGASTVFTWQHHLLDVAGGIVLGLAAAATIRPGATRAHTVAFSYLIMAALALFGAIALGSPIAAYAAASLLLVAAAYRTRRAGFLGKQAGRHPLRAWLLFWPYLAGYRLTWLLVRLRERRRPALMQMAHGLWIGRRLSNAEARRLPPDCHVIDLSAELPETARLRGNYRHIPLMDLHAPRPKQLRAVLAAIAQQHAAGRPVYVHCAMGYSRSRLIARLYLRKHPPCPSRSTN